MRLPLPPDLRHIYRWDLDKTYLETDFRLHRIWRVPFTPASERQNVPGAKALLRELSQNPEAGKAQVFFISGSPRQLRATLEEKFRLDGLTPDALFLKPNLQNFLTLRWRAIREQVGYKLPLLLESRVGVPAEVDEICFGDDSESDALIYSLYADLLAGDVGDYSLRKVMEAAGAYPDAILRARDARRKLIPSRSLHTIFIHLAMGSAPERFRPYGPRVVPIRDYFQAAMVLFSAGRLSAEGVVRVADELTAFYDFRLANLGSSLQDIVSRGFLCKRSCWRLGQQLLPEALPGSLAPGLRTLRILRQKLLELPSCCQPPPPVTRIDYPALLAGVRARHRYAVHAAATPSQSAETSCRGRSPEPEVPAEHEQPGEQSSSTSPSQS